MTELPRGTVTFLLTDIEGSTALWERAPAAMSTACARHDLLFEQAVARHRGVPIRPRGEGDSRFAVFDSAVGAVSAALAFQRALAAEEWPSPRPIAVRIGVHTGHADVRDGDYYGTAVNRCARIRDLGRGGETLLSDATVAVVRDDMPPDTALRDLGERQLRGLKRAEHVFQLLDDTETVGGSTGRLNTHLRRLRRGCRRHWKGALVTLVLGSVVLGIVATLVPWPAPPEIVLLSDDFDVPNARVLPEVSEFSNEFAVGYSVGEYSIQSLLIGSNRLPSAVLPGWYANATLAIDARLIGDVLSQSIVIGCRNFAPRSGYRLTLRPAHGAGAIDRTDDVRVPIRLASFTNVGAIRRQTAQNRLELRCVDDTISATINGTLVATARDSTYRAGRMWVGGTVDPGTIAFSYILFDNLVVRGVAAPVASEDQGPAQPPANVSTVPP